MALSTYRAQMTIRGRSPVGSILGNGHADGDCGTLPFSESLFPLVRHPLIKAAGPMAASWLLAQRLYGYLDWTFALETDVVLPVARRMAAADFYQLQAGADLATDARRIILDEEFHAAEAIDAKHAVVKATGILPATPYIPPSFMTRLETVERRTESHEQQWVRFVFTLVSETLITGLLTDLPRDDTVLPVVRETVRRHAIDEAGHHRVFAKVMAIAWDRWSQEQRERYAPWFAEFLKAFLAPDENSTAHWLKHLGLAREDIRAVIEDVFAPSAQAQRIREASEPSLRAMRRAGLFDHQSFVDALGADGLI